LINIAESALDRSVTLAAALTARGYVHSNAAGTKRRLLLASAFCLLFFATGLVVFGYSPQILVGGLLSATMMWFGFEATNRSNVRTRYRANTWDLNSVLLAASPVLALAVFFAIDSQTAGTQTTWLASAAALTLGLTFIKRTEIWHATSSRHAEVES
jgi:hypothetical protein